MRLNSAKAIMNGLDIYVDKTNSKVFPFTLRGGTVVPVRFVENLGARVKYDGADKPVTVTYGNITVTLRFDVAAYTVRTGGKTETKQFSVPPTLVEGKTVVPFRPVAEALGFAVRYDSASYVIVVHMGVSGLTEKTYRAAVETGRKIPANVQGVKGITAVRPGRTMKVGQRISLSQTDVRFSPADAGVKFLLYKSGDPSVAEVSSKGQLTGRKRGVAVVTVSSHNGKTTRFNVTVV